MNKLIQAIKGSLLISTFFMVVGIIMTLIAKKMDSFDFGDMLLGYLVIFTFTLLMWLLSNFLNKRYNY